MAAANNAGNSHTQAINHKVVMTAVWAVAGLLLVPVSSARSSHHGLTCNVDDTSTPGHRNPAQREGWWRRQTTTARILVLALPVLVLVLLAAVFTRRHPLPQPQGPGSPPNAQTRASAGPPTSTPPSSTRKPTPHSPAQAQPNSRPHSFAGPTQPQIQLLRKRTRSCRSW